MLVNNSVNAQYKISPQNVFSSPVRFSGEKDRFEKAEKDKRYKNPINSGFEYLDAAKLTALAGLGVAGRFLLETFVWTDVPSSKRELKAVVLFALIIGVASAILSLPKNLYKRKVETFAKKKEMDVYVRTNSAEQGFYERFDKEAQEADEKHKKELMQDYLKLRMAKNQVPEFIKKY